MNMRHLDYNNVVYGVHKIFQSVLYFRNVILFHGACVNVV